VSWWRATTWETLMLWKAAPFGLAKGCMGFSYRCGKNLVGWV